MRGALLLLGVLLFAGCATDAPHESDTWTFTQRDGSEEPTPLGTARAGYALDTTFDASMRQITGNYHGSFPAGQTILLSWNASTPVDGEARFLAGGGATAGVGCTWGANETAEKDVGVGRVNIRATDSTCTIRFTPNRDLAPDDGIPLRWGIRARATEGPWSLAFSSRLA